MRRESLRADDPAPSDRQVLADNCPSADGRFTTDFELGVRCWCDDNQNRTVPLTAPLIASWRELDHPSERRLRGAGEISTMWVISVRVPTP